MTARKPKPRKAAPRKGSKASTIEQRIKAIDEWANKLMEKQGIAYSNIRDERDELARRIDALEAEIFPAQFRRISRIKSITARLDALETRKQFRDASHDEPVSNAGEAIGVPLTPAQLARLMAYEGKRWWQFWRRL